MTTELMTALPDVVSDYIDRVNNFDNDGIVIVFPFALSANVNDDRREIWGD